MKKLLVILLLVCIVWTSFTAVAEIQLDFSSATDEELDMAIEAIKAEKKLRLHTQIVLSETDLKLAKGKTEKIVASIEGLPEGMKQPKLVWTTSDKSVATCTNGTIKAIGAGDAVITCSAKLADETTIEEECQIEVYIAVSSVKVNKKKFTIQKDESFTPEFSIQPSNATNQELVFSSDNPSAAIVDEDGDVVGIGSGTAKITAETVDGSNKSVTFTVEVIEEQKSIAETNKKPHKAFNRTLREGKYVIGKDIPAGRYEITCVDSEGETYSTLYSSLGGLYGDESVASSFSALGNMMEELVETDIEILGDYGDVMRSVSMKTGDTVELVLEEKTAIKISGGKCEIKSIE